MPLVSLPSPFIVLPPMPTLPLGNAHNAHNVNDANNADDNAEEDVKESDSKSRSHQKHLYISTWDNHRVVVVLSIATPNRVHCHCIPPKSLLVGNEYLADMSEKDVIVSDAVG
jgi:hypothetical protein